MSNDDSSFEGERLEVNLSMQPGDAFTLSLWMQHDWKDARPCFVGWFRTERRRHCDRGDIYEPSATHGCPGVLRSR